MTKLVLKQFTKLYAIFLLLLLNKIIIINSKLTHM